MPFAVFSLVGDPFFGTRNGAYGQSRSFSRHLRACRKSVEFIDRIRDEVASRSGPRPSNDRLCNTTSHPFLEFDSHCLPPFLPSSFGRESGNERSLAWTQYQSISVGGSSSIHHRRQAKRRPVDRKSAVHPAFRESGVPGGTHLLELAITLDAARRQIADLFGSPLSGRLNPSSASPKLLALFLGSKAGRRDTAG